MITHLQKTFKMATFPHSVVFRIKSIRVMHLPNCSCAFSELLFF